MKIRNGMVSNSSSSSFILALDENADLKDVVITIKTKVNLNHYLDKKLKNISLDEAEELANQYYLDDKQKECLMQNIIHGKTIAVLSVGTDCDLDLEDYAVYYASSESYPKNITLIKECEDLWR